MSGGSASGVRSRAGRLDAVRRMAAALREPSQFDHSLARRLLDATTPDELVALATHHRVGGMLYEKLRAFAPDDPVVRRLGEGYEAAALGHMRILWELAHLVPKLDAIRRRWAVIKGPVLVEALYGVPGRRPYADIDLLVDPAGFRDIVGEFERAGARLVDSNWRVIHRDLRGEVHLVLSGAIPVDLHWNVVNMYRRGIWIDSAELLDRSVAVELGAFSVRTLDPTDAILHLAVHASMSGGDRLIWLKDIERSAALRPPSWEDVVERARRWKVAGAAGLMFERTVAALGAPIPPWVVDHLLRRGTRTLIHLVDRISPWELSMGRLTAGNVMLARSIAHGIVGGPVWIAERTLRSFDPREPAASSVFTPGGGDRERDAFMDSVAAMGRHRRAVGNGAGSP